MAPNQAIVGYRQSCSQLGYSILMSHTSLIISIVFTCELLPVNLHVNKNVAIKTSQKQPADEKCQKGPKRKRETLVKERVKCLQSSNFLV